MKIPALTVRASAWGKLFDCAYKFEGENILGMRKPSGMRAALGTALHASTAAFDHARVASAAISADAAAGILVDRLRQPQFEVDASQDDLSIRDAERIGLSLHSTYCADWSPRYQFSGVELETRPLDIDCGGGIMVRITGTLDRSRIIPGPDGGLRIIDLKSGSRAIEKGVAKTKGHAAQVGTYEILTEHSTGQRIAGPAEIIGMQTSGRPQIASAEIPNAKALMAGTPEHPGLISFAAQMFSSGLFPPNPQSMLCAEKYCARWHRCPYHR